MVGLALVMAENSVKTAATVAAPLTSPLLRYVEHLKPLDEWACRRLDDVERMVPVVTKPTGEVWQCWRGDRERVTELHFDQPGPVGSHRVTYMWRWWSGYDARDELPGSRDNDRPWINEFT